MKVAYCLVGIVGATDFGMGLGADIDYRIAHYWNKKNIFDLDQDVDVFMHSWSTQHEEGLKETYSPKGAIFEDQIDFGLSTLRDNCIASRWYSTAICNQLRTDYEEKNNIKYDVVMFFRFDHVFLVPLDFNKYDLNKIWVRHSNPHGWVDGVRKDDNPKDTLNNGCDCKSNLNRIYDSFIFSKPENINIYSDIYNYLTDVNSKINSPHEEIPNQLRRNNLLQNLDFTFHGEIETEAVRALYKNPEYLKGEFDISKFKEFEETYVRQNPEVIKRFKLGKNQMDSFSNTNSGFNRNMRIQ